MENSFDEFLTQLLRLVNESDRRYEDATSKVCNYMIKRISSALTSVKMLLSYSSQEMLSNFSSKLDKSKLEQLSRKISDLKIIWIQKYETVADDSEEPDFNRYKPSVVHTGKPGRPSLHIDMEAVLALKGYSFSWKMISKIFSIHRTTLWRKLKEHGLEGEMSFTDMHEQQLDEMIGKLKQTHPLAGERTIIGMLRSKGMNIQRWKIRESIHRTGPVNPAIRWIQKNPRCIYSVPGPNSLWHNDGLHKLIHWGIVIHAYIDGFSRLATSLLCATNNRAETALKGFLQGVERYGIPSRVRGDFGGENVRIADFINHNGGVYIRGPSVHNQRIERLHYDTTHCVLSHFIDLFIFMEENSILQRNDLIHLFSLQFVHLPRIQFALDEFREGWNHHPVSTERNKTPSKH